ncbi:LysR family transcriptional regulator [Novosphingobium sp.]|uniref:LysR family transcriptional regulator n=1 Tax=Novosphingobium sp. TaxID=1874826 RepID=UPI0025DD0AC6|nr:LysR family transcriptional regulator [Novosphingobium sp.]
MRFKGLDLNLLLVLEVLLNERNVTAAAKRLNLSQPATSSALARLRLYFDDELLLPTGRVMLPTAHALSLQPMIREVLGDVERLIAASTAFDPATSERRFRLAGSDYIFTTLVAPLIALLQNEAPNVSFEVSSLTPQIIQYLERGDVDLILTPRQFTSPHHPSVLIFEEPHVIVGWSENPLFASQVSLESFLASPQVSVELGPQRTRPFAEEQMHSIGLNRRIDVIAPTFAAVPWLLPNSTRIAVLHQRLALTFSKVLPLAIAALPFPMPLMEEMAQYHRTREKDGGLLWLLEQMQNYAKRQLMSQRSTGPG